MIAENKTSSLETVFRSEKVDYLSRFTQGQSGTIVEMVAEPELQGRLMGMGLFVGTRFRVLQGGNRPHQPMLIAIGETRIALGSSIASQILVEK
jgi:Fe2+ transport system protein FeoA